MTTNPIRVDMALIHYPVVNRQGDTVGSAITNLDVHDLARAARTFGVGAVYMVTPYHDQQHLFQEILDHWLSGPGGKANPHRREALERVTICNDLAEVINRVTEQRGQRPMVLSTSARQERLLLPYPEARTRIEAGESFLLLFGTAWGLAPEVIAATDGLLPPIHGNGDYNHLSVRSAVSIVLDRLLGQ